MEEVVTINPSAPKAPEVIAPYPSEVDWVLTVEAARQSIVDKLRADETSAPYQIVTEMLRYVKESGCSQLRSWDPRTGTNGLNGKRSVHREVEKKVLAIIRKMHLQYGPWIFETLDYTGLRITHRRSLEGCRVEVIDKFDMIELGAGARWD